MSDTHDRMVHIVKAVAVRLGLLERDIMGRCRTPRFARARHLAMMLCYDLSGGNVSDVARFFGRDRATIYHAMAQTRRRLSNLDQHRALGRAWRLTREDFLP